ncbi:hypothetical protein K2P97_04220 [bacterium]|nr:hypothetical protein [bacterium]
MKKKYVLYILGICALGAILYVGLPPKGLGSKSVLTKACEVATPDISLQTDIVQSIENFSIVRSLNWIDSQKKHNFPLSLLKSDFVGVFKKEKIILAAGIPNTEKDSELYRIEILNDTSCALVKYFKDDANTVFVGLLNNPWYFLKSVLQDSSNSLTISHLKTLGFKVLEKNGDEIILHSYPALSIQLKIKTSESCKESNCDDFAEVVEVKNVYKQFIIEDDAGAVVSKSNPINYSLNEQKFPLAIGKDTQ